MFINEEREESLEPCRFLVPREPVGKIIHKNRWYEKLITGHHERRLTCRYLGIR